MEVRLATLTDADEQLLAACVTLDPTFQHRSVTLAGGLFEATDATNVVVAATDRRVLLVDARFRGAAKTMVGPFLEAITSRTSGGS